MLKGKNTKCCPLTVDLSSYRLYQKKAEEFEKELMVAKQQNKRLKAIVENLRNQLEQNVS